MSMSEIVSFLDLSVYPSVALVFFLAAFIAIIWWAMTRSKQEIDDAASIVLNDDKIITPRHSIKTEKEPNDKGVDHV